MKLKSKTFHREQNREKTEIRYTFLKNKKKVSMKSSSLALIFLSVLVVSTNFVEGTLKSLLKRPIFAQYAKAEKNWRKKQSTTSSDETEKENEMYEMHSEVAYNQRRQYKAHKEKFKDGECIIVMDFKQNLKIGGYQRNGSRATDLAFVLVSSDLAAFFRCGATAAGTLG